MQRSMTWEKFLRQHSQLPLRPRVWRRPSNAHVSCAVQATLVQGPHTHHLRTNTSTCYQLSADFDKGIFSEVLGNVALVPALPLTRYGHLDKSPLSSLVTGWMSLRIFLRWDSSEWRGKKGGFALNPHSGPCLVLGLKHTLSWQQTGKIDNFVSKLYQRAQS